MDPGKDRGSERTQSEAHITPIKSTRPHHVQRLILCLLDVALSCWVGQVDADERMRLWQLRSELDACKVALRFWREGFRVVFTWHSHTFKPVTFEYMSFSKVRDREVSLPRHWDRALVSILKCCRVRRTIALPSFPSNLQTHHMHELHGPFLKQKCRPLSHLTSPAHR